MKNEVSSPLAGRHQRVKGFYVYVVWANAKAFPVKWTSHSNKEIAHNIDRSVSLPFSNSCFISLISVVEPDKRNIPWWTKPINKHKSKRKNKFTTRNKQTNKQKTGFPTTYTNTEILFRLLNKDRIVLHPFKKRCCAINKCNSFLLYLIQ